MATNITVVMRCTAKNLTTAPPPGGGAAVDSVNVTLTLQQGSTPGPAATASLAITIPLTGDTFQVGNYYNMALTDGVAPTMAARSQSQQQAADAGTPQAQPPQAQVPPGWPPQQWPPPQQ
jgi:hypothetical protein